MEGDNLKLNSTKENSHDYPVGSLTKLGYAHILSGSYDGDIKIW